MRSLNGRVMVGRRVLQQGCYTTKNNSERSRLEDRKDIKNYPPASQSSVARGESLVISVSAAWWLLAQSNKDRLGKKDERICRKELGGS